MIMYNNFIHNTVFTLTPVANTCASRWLFACAVAQSIVPVEEYSVPPEPHVTSGEATKMITVSHETETRAGAAAPEVEGVEAVPGDGGERSDQGQPSGGQSDVVEQTEGLQRVEGEMSQSPGLRNFAPQFELEVHAHVQVYLTSVCYTCMFPVNCLIYTTACDMYFMNFFQSAKKLLQSSPQPGHNTVSLVYCAC